MDVKNPQNGGIGNTKNILRKRFLTVTYSFDDTLFESGD